ncbi:SRPBCC family protein, partial [Spongiibacter sp.]|uniref:SRPBCC family protein n=1 Tax=Spongiibacter sp. TaxID=2024860 RepID=UPI003562AF45
PERRAMAPPFDIPNRILVAIGGNATHPEDIEGTSKEQKEIAASTARALLPLALLDNELVVTHGNGPVVGKILMRHVPRPGHGAAVRLMPEDSDDSARAWGLEGIAALSGNAEYREYLLERQAMAEECIGKVGARIKGLTYGVYPNLSLLWSNSTLRVSHPRGPGEIDYWSWWLLPKDAPEGIRKLLRSNFTLMFGPGGLLEQEDGEAWSQQYNGVNISYMDDSPLHYGLGQGSEGPHPELPGQIGSCYSEHYARAFYQRWRQDIENGLRRAGA